jgi:cation transport ATPase
MDILKYATKLEMDTTSTVPFMMVDGYKVQLSTMKAGFVKQIALVIVVDRKLEKEDIKRLTKAYGLRALIIQNVGLKNNAIFLPIGQNAKKEKIQTNLLKITSVLKSLDIKNLAHCPFCGKNEDLDTKKIVKGVEVEIHQACATEFIEHAEKNLDQHEDKPYVLGILFAIFGAFVGMIPSAIVLFQFGIISAWLFIIIPVASFYFYKKSRSPKTMIAVLVVSIISVIVALFLGFLHYLLIAISYGQTFSELMVDNATLFYTDLAMIFFFAVVGVALSWRLLYKDTSSAARKELEDFKA